MSESMIRVREAQEVAHDEEVDLEGLIRAMDFEIEIPRYAGAVGDAAFELSVEQTFVTQIASACLLGRAPSFGSRLLLEHDPLHETVWRLSDGTLVDLSNAPELLEKAQLLERVRSACKMLLAS